MVAQNSRTRRGSSGRTAYGVSADGKAANLKRLRRIEGQVRGIAAMISEDRYCTDILDQIAAVQNALRSVARELLRNHLEHCATKAFTGTPEAAAAMRDELLRLFEKRLG